MSIFKETFQSFVFNQLKIREAILDQKSNRLLGTPTIKDLKLETLDSPTTITLPAGSFYTNTTSKQCVIRMSSGVDLKEENDLIEKSNPNENPEDLKGEGLAVRYILEGGIPLKNADKTIYREYIDKDSTKMKVTPRGNNQFTQKSSYGDPFIRSDAKDNFGIVPMPGIIDAQIRTKTAYGSLRDAKINFVCHNRRQLDVLETLYMRPGMPILLEWGWSPYINNKGQRETYFPYLWKWFDQNQTINSINTIIHERIKNSGGNYDGFVGFVKNYEIVARPDGGYDCTTELAAMGEVLEGIKGKSEGLFIVKNSEKLEVDNLEYYLKALRAYCEYEYAHKKANTFSGKYNVFDVSDQGENIASEILYGSTGGEDGFYKNITNNVLPLIAHDKKIINQSLDINALDEYLLYKGEPLGVVGDEEFSETSTEASSHYVKWELLVLILNKLVIDTYQTGPKPESSSPLTEITLIDEIDPLPPLTPQPLKYSKYKFKNDQFITFSRTKEGGNRQVTSTLSDLLDMSIDPSVCLLPHQLGSLVSDKLDSAANKSDTYIGSKFESHVFVGGSTTPVISSKENTNINNRNIKDIFINLDHLIKKYKRTRYKGDEINEDFNLFTFLQTIWEKDINNACGGVHDFTLHTEKTRGNIIRVIDMQRSSITPEKLYEFKIQSNKSIVRDFNYNTTIDSKLSSTISIASQSPNSINDLDAVSFAAFNRNIKYRFFKEAIEESDNNQEKKSQKYDDDLENLEKQLGYLYDYKLILLQGKYTDNKGKIDSEMLNVSTARKYIKSLESKIISLKSRYSKTIPKTEPPIYKGFRKRDNNPTKSTIIPLKFNAKIDGIGGLVIGNIFKIDKEFLPKGYQEDDVAFAILTENQTITAGQDWTTEFSGQMLLLDLEKEGEHEDIILLPNNTNIQSQTGLVSANASDLISTEQQIIDEGLNELNKGDKVYLKINNTSTNVRTGTEIDNMTVGEQIGRGGVFAGDNIIGTIPKGNKGLLLGTIALKVDKLPQPKWIVREAGTPLTEEQLKILDPNGPANGSLVVIKNGVEYERISIKAPLSPYGEFTAFEAFRELGIGGAYEHRWETVPQEDGYYLLEIPKGKQRFYAFEQNITERWYLIEFDESVEIEGQGIFNLFNDDKLKNDSSIPVTNGGWMRADVLQSTNTPFVPTLSSEEAEDAGSLPIEVDEGGRGYYLDILGPQKRIIVKDTNFTILYTGQYSMTASNETLIEEAKIALGLPI